MTLLELMAHLKALEQRIVDMSDKEIDSFPAEAAREMFADVMGSIPTLISALEGCLATLTKINFCRTQTEAWTLSANCLKRIGVERNE